MRLPIFTRHIIVITITAIALALFIPFSVKIFHSDSIINLKRKPEGTTELFFSDHFNLPKQIEAGEPYSFEFTTHNFEYEELTYFYEVIVSNNEVNNLMKKGEFVLQHDQTITIPVEFIMSDNFGRAKVVVRLTNKNQEINFWVEESS